MVKDYVLVSVDEYTQLVYSSAELDALECVGVDNWSGYGEVDWESLEGEEATEIREDIQAMPKYNSRGEKL